MFRCLEGLASLSAGGTGLCRQPGGAVPEAVNLVDARFDRPRRRQQPGCSTCLLRGGQFGGHQGAVSARQETWLEVDERIPHGSRRRKHRVRHIASSQDTNSQDEGRKPDLDATPSIVEHTFVVKQNRGPEQSGANTDPLNRGHSCTSEAPAIDFGGQPTDIEARTDVLPESPHGVTDPDLPKNEFGIPTAAR